MKKIHVFGVKYMHMYVHFLPLTCNNDLRKNFYYFVVFVFVCMEWTVVSRSWRLHFFVSTWIWFLGHCFNYCLWLIKILLLPCTSYCYLFLYATIILVLRIPNMRYYHHLQIKCYWPQHFHTKRLLLLCSEVKRSWHFVSVTATSSSCENCLGRETSLLPKYQIRQVTGKYHDEGRRNSKKRQSQITAQTTCSECWRLRSLLDQSRLGNRGIIICRYNLRYIVHDWIYTCRTWINIQHYFLETVKAVQYNTVQCNRCLLCHTFTCS